MHGGLLPYNKAELYTDSVLVSFLASHKADLEKISNIQNQVSFPKNHKRNAFLKVIYEAQIVKDFKLNHFIQDKLLFYKVFVRQNPEFAKFHPYTMGLQSFAIKYFENHDYVSSDFIKSHLLETYGTDSVILKKAVALNSDRKNIIFNKEKLNRYLLNYLKNFNEFEPFLNLEYNAILSGEEFLLQKNIDCSNDVKNFEYRVHTYEKSTIEGGTYTRWDTGWDNKLFKEINIQVETMLTYIPDYLLKRQAFAWDVVYVNNQLQIVEANTNRGMDIHWSGDLYIPDVVSGYIKHWSKNNIFSMNSLIWKDMENEKLDEEKWIVSEGIDKVNWHKEMKRASGNVGASLRA